jgi:transposase
MFWKKKSHIKHREYPIKRDEYGVSARKRAFKLFDQGMRPAKIANQVGVSKDTAFRYFEDWKKQPCDLDTKYTLVKRFFRNNPGALERVAQYISEMYGMSVEKVIEKLQTPHGLKQFVKGEWTNYVDERRKAVEESRLRAAKQLIWLTDNSHFDIVERLTAWWDEYMGEREEINKKYDEIKGGKSAPKLE